jgi:hypothetical protein
VLFFSPSLQAEEPILRVGIIGLDTSHATAFTDMINAEKPDPEFAGVRVVCAYPQGSPDIPSSVSKVPEYIAAVKAKGVEIVSSIPELLERVDAVLLETNDGRPHLEQVIPVLKAGKPVFIDKPIAGSLADTLMIFDLANQYKSPVFSSSSLRYISGIKALENGTIGEITGCFAYSPCPLEKTHPDLFWYGIHGVEIVFTVMGTGCEKVVRDSTDLNDTVIGEWKGGKTGVFQGRRSITTGYQGGYGGMVLGTKSTQDLGTYAGYKPLLVEVVKFFKTKQSPVSAETTIEIYAFMEAADESKRRGGVPVALKEVIDMAKVKNRSR